MIEEIIKKDEYKHHAHHVFNGYYVDMCSSCYSQKHHNQLSIEDWADLSDAWDEGEEYA